MKHIVRFLSVFLFLQMAQAQENKSSYETLWQRVEKLEHDQLTKSALEVVTSISTKAHKDKNTVESVKALLYKSKYALQLEEDAQLHIVNDFKSAIQQASYPTKNILESYLANLYWQFFQEHRYQFYNRTKTASKVDATDFRTWDLTTLFKEISIHFEASLEKETLLKQTPISKFDALLNKLKDSEEYRPTLFDLLAHTALEFYKVNENTITRPADKFEIADPELLCDGKAFIALNITTDDDTSLQARALVVYQKLLRLHRSSKKIDAYAIVNIERLLYLYQHATFENKEQQFLDVLQNEASENIGSEASSLYRYEISALLNRQGTTYQPKIKEESRWKTKEALAICEQVISDFPNSLGAEKCRRLRSQILEQKLSLTTESHIPINVTGRLSVDYKNLDALVLSARKISKRELDAFSKLYKQSQKIDFIKKLNVVSTWNTPLKNENDFQSHRTEISIPPLENGQYLIVAKPKDNPNKVISFSQIQITNLALLETQTDTHHYFQVVDRNNGKPIEQANLTIHYRKNYNGPRLRKNMTTDALGNVAISLKDENWSAINIVINHNKETAYFNGYYINSSYKRPKASSSNSCFLFTDRSIYRPGQPLYFKGIAIKTSNESSSILDNTAITVQFKDVNGQVLSKKEYTTNDYGSFSGEFVIPNNGLTGEFSMQVLSNKIAINGSTRFSVEEYKRPKFETVFEPVTKTYKVNDTVTIIGKATAYAGSMITDAKVSYRVKRVVYYPRWYYWYHRNQNTSPQEIAHGETTTDASGNYEIDFKALADTTTNRMNKPTFNYEVTADVTDINGETHSTITTVKIGYHSMTAQLTASARINKDASDNLLTITSKNLNEQFVPAKGVVKMYKLKAPEYVLRPRVWEAPDYPGFSKSEFRKHYPHDAYEKEDNPAFWEKGELVWQANFNTGKSKEISIKNTTKWPSGKYVIELFTQDKFGQEVKDVLQTTLFSPKDKRLTDHELFQINTNKPTYAIGDKVTATLFSSAKNMAVTVYIEKNHQIIDTRIIHLSNNSKHITIPVHKDDVGGFSISYSYVAFNSFHTGSLNIQVPYPKTDLTIETVTFRDKLKPGTDETWSFKIKGPKGDKVSAELLASMYDASLDSFREHQWQFNPLTKPTYYGSIRTNAHSAFDTNRFNTYLQNNYYSFTSPSFDSFNRFGLYFGYGGRNRMQTLRKSKSQRAFSSGMVDEQEMEMDARFETLQGVASLSPTEELDKVVFKDSVTDNKAPTDTSNTSSQVIQIRKNLQETAFFFPQLQTDKEGNVTFSFNTPEALTKWNLQLLAHSKNLEHTIKRMETVTQKELMVTPNAPRFLREGDVIYISTKIANLTDQKLSGSAHLELTDAVSNTDVSSNLISGAALETTKKFMVDAEGNTQVSWKLTLPEGLQAIQYKVIAKAGNFSDGEQNLLPVLTNRMLVTETLPMWVNSNQTKTFTLEKLKNIASTTLKHHKLTLEITSNPAWYAVQALPYLMEYPYECNEQTFSKYYANTLATYIANSNPRIEAVFKQWANADALISNLEKNQELKSLLIQETPWLRDAQSETEQKKRIGLLFNLTAMKSKQAIALNKLQQNQNSSGAWSWFNGGPNSRYITQHIISGFGHLKQLKANDDSQGRQKNMISKAISYLDREFVKEYQQMKSNTANINDDHLSQTQIHYLYMRSFFEDINTSKKVDDITAYYKKQAQKYWVNKNLYSQAMLALILHRMNSNEAALKVTRALKENSITSEELGMYWKKNTSSWHWYQAPIETHSLLIEAFSEIHPTELETIDNLKIWLLKNKQTNQWKTTKATTEAVYALLLQGSDWPSVTDAVEVLVGDKKIDRSQLENVKAEAGTGYYKTEWHGDAVNRKMAEVQLKKKGKGIAWGALYWQYFEDLDKITSAETPLKLEKKLFLKKNTATGETISEITSKTTVQIGDLVRVRIVLRADRPMEFVHMKDMRAAAFEPINVISSYKWQDGLGYYESTKDASTNFFFDYLPKGVYVFEYDVRVNNAGDFSNGITTIQSMYAPEFSSHSEGVRVKIK